MEKWVGYNNGNYTVRLNTVNGTKIRMCDDERMIPDTIESMDIKITNKCLGPRYTYKDENGNWKSINIPCKMCHENSGPCGKHADLTFEGTFLEKLHPYTELALGGGDPLEHPDLEKFLRECKEHKLIPSMTVQESQFMNNFDFIKYLYDERLIYGIGVSLTDATGMDPKYCCIDRNKELDNLIECLKEIPTCVIHTIAGLTSEGTYKYLSNHGLKVLVLGYKKFRRGEDLYESNSLIIDEEIYSLRNTVKTMIDENWFDTLSFDNLALEQLDIKSLMSDKEWEQFYMGDDGIGEDFDSATMYVDMVERKFAKNSCDPVRYDLLPTIEEMYKFLKEVNNNDN